MIIYPLIHFSIKGLYFIDEVDTPKNLYGSTNKFSKARRDEFCQAFLFILQLTNCGSGTGR